MKSLEKRNKWKENSWVTDDCDKIIRLDFSEFTLNNSYWINNLKNFLSVFYKTMRKLLDGTFVSELKYKFVLFPTTRVYIDLCYICYRWLKLLRMELILLFFKQVTNIAEIFGLLPHKLGRVENNNNKQYEEQNEDTSICMYSSVNVRWMRKGNMTRWDFIT